MKTSGFLQIPSHLVAQLFLPGDVGLLVVPPQRAEEEPSLIFTEDGFCLVIIVSPSSALETHLLSSFHREEGPKAKQGVHCYSARKKWSWDSN